MYSHQRWLVLLVVSMALFLIAIDGTVLYTALPRLTQELHATNTQKLWIINAYPLVMAGLLISTGTLGDRLGHRRLLMGGLVMFGLASVVAAYSPSPTLLIAARAFLAVGGAMMMPATLSIIRLTFTDPQERGLAIGVWAAVASGGAAIGPVVGGLLLEYFWWGSVFLINVPVVAVALLLTRLLVPPTPANPQRPWHISGALMVMAGLVGVVYAMKEMAAPHAAPHPSLPVILGTSVGGMVFLLLFWRQQQRMTTPMVDFSLFYNRVFSCGVLCATISMLGLIGVLLVFTQKLQLVLGLSPLQAAFAIMPMSLGSLVAGPAAGMVAHRIGNTRLLWLSLLICCSGLIGLMMLHHASVIGQIIPLVVAGVGFGAVMTAASNAIMLSAPAEKAGMAASIEEVSYEVGSTIGVALIGSVLSWAYTREFLLLSCGEAPQQAADSLDGALIAATALPAPQSEVMIYTAKAAFEHGFIWALGVSVALLLLAAAATGQAGRSR